MTREIENQPARSKNCNLNLILTCNVNKKYRVKLNSIQPLMRQDAKDQIRLVKTQSMCYFVL